MDDPLIAEKWKCFFLTANLTVSMKLLGFGFGELQMFESLIDKRINMKVGTQFLNHDFWVQQIKKKKKKNELARPKYTFCGSAIIA